MMHRDLKSPNVLLSEEGVAKIADVGMVRPQVQDLVTAQPIMTPLWAAPEVNLPFAYPAGACRQHRVCLVVCVHSGHEEDRWRMPVCCAQRCMLYPTYVCLLCPRMFVSPADEPQD